MRGIEWAQVDRPEVAGPIEEGLVEADEVDRGESGGGPAR